MLKSLIFLLSILPSLVLSQSAPQKLLSTSGDAFYNNSGILEFSIGEISIETYENDIILSQGFHQYDITVSSINDIKLIDNIIVYPNPSKDWVNIDFKKPIDGYVRLTDIHGKLVLESVINNNKYHKFNTQQFSHGIYTLSILVDNVLSVYQIQKHK